MSLWTLVGTKMGVHLLLWRNGAYEKGQQLYEQWMFVNRYYRLELHSWALVVLLSIGLSVYLSEQLDQRAVSLLPESMLVHKSAQDLDCKGGLISSVDACRQPVQKVSVAFSVWNRTSIGLLTLFVIWYIWALWLIGSIGVISPLTLEQNREYAKKNIRIARSQSKHCTFYKRWCLTIKQMQEKGLGHYLYTHISNGGTLVVHPPGIEHYDVSAIRARSYAVTVKSMVTFMDPLRITGAQRKALKDQKMTIGHWIQWAMCFIAPIGILGLVLGTWLHYGVNAVLNINASSWSQIQFHYDMVLFLPFICAGAWMMLLLSVHGWINLGAGFWMSNRLHHLLWWIKGATDTSIRQSVQCWKKRWWGNEKQVGTAAGIHTCVEGSLIGLSEDQQSVLVGAKHHKKISRRIGLKKDRSQPVRRHTIRDFVREYINSRKIYGWRWFWYVSVYTCALMLSVTVLCVFVQRLDTMEPKPLIPQNTYSSIRGPGVLASEFLLQSIVSASRGVDVMQWEKALGDPSSLDYHTLQKVGKIERWRWTDYNNLVIVLLIGYIICFGQALWYWLQPKLFPYYEHYTLCVDPNVVMYKSLIHQDSAQEYLFPHYKTVVAQWAQTLPQTVRVQWCIGFLLLYSTSMFVAFSHWHPFAQSAKNVVEPVSITVALLSPFLGYIGYVSVRVLIGLIFVFLILIKSALVFFGQCLCDHTRRTELKNRVIGYQNMVFILFLKVKNSIKQYYLYLNRAVHDSYDQWYDDQMKSGAFQKAQQQWLHTQVRARNRSSDRVHRMEQKDTDNPNEHPQEKSRHQQVNAPSGSERQSVKKSVRRL